MISFSFLFPETLAALIMAMSPTVAGPSTLPGSSGQFVTREITTEQGIRRYKLFIPGGYNGSMALPLVVMLHGCTQDPDNIARGTRLNDLAEERSVLVAYPEQPETANIRKCWNWYDAAHQKRDAGEPALIAAITRQVMKDYRVDEKRVYVAGISAGGAMAIVAALTYPDLYAAVGSHSGIPLGAATSLGEALSAMQGHGKDPASLATSATTVMGARSRAIPGIVFQGGKDAVVNSANAAQIVAQLVAVQGKQPDNKPTAASPEKRDSADGYHYLRTIQGSGDGTVELWLIDELGHAWSGGSADGTFTDTHGPNATKEMLRFFLEHPRSAK
jgi:poly(hydroxyalkanoate) depolymerase family esterase